MPDIDQDELNFAIQTATAPAPSFADTINAQVNSAGYTTLTFFFTPSSGAKYIRTSACVCVPTQIALAISDLVRKSIEQQSQAPKEITDKDKKSVN